jgi:3-oxoadipate enol-lactonase
VPYLQTGNIRTYYEINGSGDPLLLIHGLGSSTRDWEFNQPALSKKYRIITYDVRGHGQSDKPPGPYSIADFAADAAGLLETLETGSVHVAGVSMGGMIGLQLALDSPSLVRSLAVVNSGPELRLDGTRAKMMLWLRLFIVRVLGMRMVGRKLAREMFPESDQQEMRRKVITRWAENDKRCYLDSIRALVNWSVTNRLTEISCPVIEIRGDLDQTPLSLSDEQLATIPDARREVIPGSRHATPVDRADEFNLALLNFLDACGGAAEPTPGNPKP